MSEFKAILKTAEEALTDLLGTPVKVSVHVRGELTHEVIRKASYHWCGNSTKRKDEAQSLLLLVCEEYMISVTEIQKGGRGVLFADARRAFCHLTNKHLKLHPNVIGRYINKDRTSVLHTIKRAEDLLAANDDMSEKIKTIETNFLTLKQTQ